MLIVKLQSPDDKITITFFQALLAVELEHFELISSIWKLKVQLFWYQGKLE